MEIQPGTPCHARQFFYIDVPLIYHGFQPFCLFVTELYYLNIGPQDKICANLFNDAGLLHSMSIQ